MHDLLVLSRTVDHPAQFLEYLRRRRGRMLATMVKGVDELDMFMWFVNGGMYSEPDPRDVAARIPIDRPMKASDVRRYEQQSRVGLGTLTDPLDAWIYSSEGLSHTETPKPTRREEPWVEQYLSASESAQSPGWLRFGADLVGLSDEAQRDIGRSLVEQTRQARGGDIERSLTTHGTTSFGSWLLTASVVPDGASTEHLAPYIEAKQYQTRSSRSMLLLYRTDGLSRAPAIAASPNLGQSSETPPSLLFRSKASRRHSTLHRRTRSRPARDVPPGGFAASGARRAVDVVERRAGPPGG